MYVCMYVCRHVPLESLEEADAVRAFTGRCCGIGLCQGVHVQGWGQLCTWPDWREWAYSIKPSHAIPTMYTGHKVVLTAKRNEAVLRSPRRHWIAFGFGVQIAASTRMHTHLRLKACPCWTCMHAHKTASAATALRILLRTVACPQRFSVHGESTQQGASRGACRAQTDCRQALTGHGNEGRHTLAQPRAVPALSPTAWWRRRARATLPRTPAAAAGGRCAFAGGTAHGAPAFRRTHTATTHTHATPQQALRSRSLLGRAVLFMRSKKWRHTFFFFP